MEREVFTLREVEELLEEYVVVSVVTDIGDEKANAVWEKYRAPGAGVPHYVVLNGDGEVLRRIGATLPAEKNAHKFVAFLKGEEAAAPAIVEPDDPVERRTDPESWPEGLPPGPSDHVREAFDFEAAFSAPKVRPGGEVTLELRFKMKSRGSGQFYLYHPDSPHAKALGMSLFLLETVDTGALKPLGDWEFPEPRIRPEAHPENLFDDDEWKFEGEFRAVRKFRVPDAEGSHFVSGTLAGQYCDQQGCIWFEDMSKTPFGWVASVSVAPDGVESALAGPLMEDGKGGETDTGPTAGQAEEVDESLAGQIKSRGLWVFLLGVFGLGMLTLLTPCVLPVLPLTIGFFVKQSEQDRSPLLAAVIYCGCIIGVFTAFGLITSALLGVQGAQQISTNPWVNLGIAVLFTVFALSFFGLFELRMPGVLSNWLNRKQMKSQQAGRGYMTALLSGGSFAVISFSCTGPIAAVILAAAAGEGGQGEIGMWVPTLAMLVFSAGLALPIFVMGMFPSMLKRLPKSGGWMNAIKVVFAFIEIAVAIRYFAWAEIGFRMQQYPEWITRDIVDAFWIACSVGAGLYLLGLFRMPHDHEKTEQIGVIRTMIALGFLSFGIYLVPGLVTGKPMGLLDGFMPPREVRHTGGAGGGADVHSLKWHEDLDEGLAEARATGKPVFVDFTGVVCSNCRWVETNIFPDPQVAQRLSDDFVRVQQWTDIGDQKANANYQKYGKGSLGVPMYVILKPDGTMIEKFVPPQFINSVSADDFAEFMDRGKEKFASGGS